MQWEYTSHHLDGMTDVNFINNMTLSRWELVAVDGGIAYFKRLKAPSAGWRDYEEWAVSVLKAYGIDTTKVQVTKFSLEYEPECYPVLKATVWPHETPPGFNEDEVPIEIKIHRTKDGYEVHVDDRTKIEHRDWTQFEEGLKLSAFKDDVS